MTTQRAWLTLGVVPILLLAAMLLPFALHWGELPNPMAVHWSLGNEPNGSMPPLGTLLVFGGVYVAVWWAVGRTLRTAPRDASSFVAGLFSFEALLVGFTWVMIDANLGRQAWHAADGLDIRSFLGVLLAASVAGFLGWLLAGGRTHDEPAADLPKLDLNRPASALWFGRAQGRVLQIVGALIIAMGLIDWGEKAAVYVPIGLLVLVFSEVRVTVARQGVVIGLGWFSVPHWTVPLADISRAETENVMPMAYGGWGYRIRPGVRALVVRGGESLRLVREHKADILLTVDDAETGAGLINSMIEAVGTDA